MKHCSFFSCLVVRFVGFTALTVTVTAQPSSRSLGAISLSDLGAKAGAQYQGEGLSVARTPGGARLRCVFQKLEGQVTREGLWLISTVEPQTGEQFRVAACAMGRSEAMATLPPLGSVTVADKLARFARRGLTEEYSVSVDGVRQDFVVTHRPAGTSALRVELEVTGTRAETHAHGARLVLGGSGRRIAYSRLNVVDAQGKELTARLEAMTESRLA